MIQLKYMEKKILSKTIIGLNNICKKISNRYILKNINLDINEKDIMVITGHNGAGKSTLLKILAQLTDASSGTVTYENNNIIKSLGFIFQKPIFLDRTVYDNLLYVLQVKNQKENASEVIYNNAKEYKITHLLHRSTRDLSGGEQQIISFIRALIVSPKIIFLDEALSNLDKLYIDKIESIINQISNNGIKIIMISHDDNQISRLADEVFNIKDGVIYDKI